MTVGNGIILADGIEKVGVERVRDFKLTDLEAARDSTVAAGVCGIARIVDETSESGFGTSVCVAILLSARRVRGARVTLRF